MLLKELIEKVNMELKTIFERSIIKIGYNDYDYKNGRKVISVYDVCKLLREMSENKYYFTDKKFDIEFANITLKTKRKKSDITNSWDNTNQMTVTEIYLPDYEDQELLNKTLEEIAETEKQQKNETQLEEARKKEQNKQDFITNLNKFGMTINDFITMKYQYEKLGYSERRELEGKEDRILPDEFYNN